LTETKEKERDRETLNASLVDAWMSKDDTCNSPSQGTAGEMIPGANSYTLSNNSSVHASSTTRQLVSTLDTNESEPVTSRMPNNEIENSEGQVAQLGLDSEAHLTTKRNEAIDTTSQPDSDTLGDPGPFQVVDDIRPINKQSTISRDVDDIVRKAREDALHEFFLEMRVKVRISCIDSVLAVAN